MNDRAAKTHPPCRPSWLAAGAPYVPAMLCLLLWPALASADTLFPRGPGWYFNPLKIVALLAVYLAWVATCGWANKDAKKLELDGQVWNIGLWAAGMLALVAIFALPWFWVTWALLICLWLGPAFAYAHMRDRDVPYEEKVLTRDNLRLQIYRLLRIRIATKHVEAKGPPLRFLGKSRARGGDDDARLSRVASSKGYRGALEMVAEAIQQRATDIHMEPTREEMTVRYRIDGILTGANPFSRNMGDAVINIFKVLSDLDITEKRKPQDGSFSAEYDDRIVDFRVATAGSVVGEKLVLRILDKAKQLVSLTNLGMRERIREQVRSIAQQPHGMLIVAGPTGAGKSTTLYACLAEIDRFQRNVITVENPVEYQISNVTQIEINPKAGKTFASELRSILRQDPDVIMVGEVRDQETAEIACQAAQTGHMVFTTLHANDCITALVRLIDLGVQPYSIASALSGVLSQRLVRVLCPKCRVKYKPNPDMLRKANLPVDKITHFYRPAETADEEDVCEHCGGTGYFGRTGIFELLVINDAIRDLIRANPNPNAIKQEALKQGMKYLQEDGLRVVMEGKSSIQELLRVSK